ncbi:SDR family oxidoreductase [Mesorhizobium sp. 113-1-2]|uniref:SDR family NAD(P)-dependent oxidoreductase n=1 Tax=Mesorhizobium sp. 113-1-2 TaxID=2744515 RepID=UPI00081995E5|nr:SDR family NAD(P)-dependent oxidoreductase [Mesorhizobium sp. 113-1-2]BAV49233.1 short-chain dehydrogenase/reductase SDR [Mesorhizobium loti]BCG69514.1 SDR family oxidoreductase [Mesorhizobium sp. 113-1-2]
MANFPYRCALIIGAGPGISASLARRLSKIGVRVGLAARDVQKLQPLVEEIAAAVFAVDASQPDAMVQLFLDMERQVGEPDIVIYNASSRVAGPLASVDPAAVEKAMSITAFGAFLAAQQAAKRMETKGHGAILFTGASAGVKGFAQSAAFAMGKFGLRGLAQSAARELGPKEIHVAHFNIDGGVRSSRRPDPSGSPDSTLDPDAIAQTYVDILAQPRNAWSHEIDLRPWTERF